MLSYIKCLNDVKLALIRKETYTFIKITNKNIVMLSLLLKYNVINSFCKINVKNKKIFIVHINTNFNHINLISIYKQSSPIHLKINIMNKLPNKNASNVYMLSTSKGFIEFKEALKLKIGGILIFKIN